jgi:hypothetical protein
MGGSLFWDRGDTPFLADDIEMFLRTRFNLARMET